MSGKSTFVKIKTSMRNIVLILLLFLVACTDNIEEKSKPYRAGFQTISFVDTSRNYKPNTDTTDYLHYRPIDLDVWYPADSLATDTPLLVHDLLGLLEQRANYYSASNVGNGITGQLAQYFCNGFKCSDSTKLLRFKTNTFKNAPEVKGKFPLVIYMTAFNGMSYENYSLFESLAKKGYVVVSISSIGRFPGDMTMKKADLMEQVNDAVIALDTLKRNFNIDLDRIGIVGYSWGGLAGAILAGKIANVKCLVSLEGSEFHHYGYEKQEDADFHAITESDDFKTLMLSAPYLRLESAPQDQTGRKDSVYRFFPKKVNNAQVFAIDSMKHEDFGCFSLIVKKSGNCIEDKRYLTALHLTLSFLDDHLKNSRSFSSIIKDTNHRITGFKLKDLP